MSTMSSSQALSRPLQPIQPAPPLQPSGVPTSGPSQTTIHLLPTGKLTESLRWNFSFACCEIWLWNWVERLDRKLGHLGKYQWTWLLDHTGRVWFCRNCQSRVAVPVCIFTSSECEEGTVVPHPHQHLVLLVF